MKWIYNLARTPEWSRLPKFGNNKVYNHPNNGIRYQYQVLRTSKIYVIYCKHKENLLRIISIPDDGMPWCFVFLTKWHVLFTILLLVLKYTQYLQVKL